MPDFETPEYSKRAIIEAGKALRGNLSREDIEIFRIAHNWRASHVIPMQQLRRELGAKAKRVGGHPITAARLKRMRSIRQKLRTSPVTLYQMQDIAGCRVILDDRRAVDDLVAIYRSAANHDLRREWDYIGEPKSGGYRSHHLVFRYQGIGQFEGLNRNALSVEIQLRTRLQHAWATAVEAVGMVRGEDMKAGQGCPQWLRLFQLVASEFAEEERAPFVPGTPERKQRRDELGALNAQLDAVATLTSYNRAIQFAQNLKGRRHSPVFLIQYDTQTQRVAVRGLSRASSIQNYNTAEINVGVNTVLVEVDRAEDLEAAYPNYFLDVKLFTEKLRAVLAPQRRVVFEGEWWRKWLPR